MQAGQGSISMSNKQAQSGAPFAAGSAFNGVSVDAATGRIVLGNDTGGVLADLISDRQINMNGHQVLMPSTSGQTLIADTFIQLTKTAGDQISIAASSFPLLFLSHTAGAFPAQILFSAAGGPDYSLVNLGLTTGEFVIGEQGGGNGMRVVIDDPNEVFRVQRAAELMLFFSPQNYSMGNVNDTFNGSKINVEDLNRSFVFSSVIGGRRIALEGVVGTERMGDIDATGNETIIRIEDASREITFKSLSDNGFLVDMLNKLFALGDLGATGNGGFIQVTDSANQFLIANTANNMSIAMNGANGLYVVGSTQLIGSRTTLANGAGALLGTLANSPAAGNPTKWISIDDNGTIRRIPAW